MTAPDRFDPAALPRRVNGQGYVYVLQFSNGTVKAGSTANAHDRMAKHKAHAAAFGFTITSCWVSPAHASYLVSEAELLRLARAMSTEVLQLEYFIGVSADDLIAKFEAWEHAPRPGAAPQPVIATACTWTPADIPRDSSGFLDLRTDAQERAALANLEHLVGCRRCAA